MSPRDSLPGHPAEVDAVAPDRQRGELVGCTEHDVAGSAPHDRSGWAQDGHHEMARPSRGRDDGVALSRTASPRDRPDPPDTPGGAGMPSISTVSPAPRAAGTDTEHHAFPEPDHPHYHRPDAPINVCSTSWPCCWTPGGPHVRPDPGLRPPARRTVPAPSGCSSGTRTPRVRPASPSSWNRPTRGTSRRATASRMRPTTSGDRIHPGRAVGPVRGRAHPRLGRRG